MTGLERHAIPDGPGSIREYWTVAVELRSRMELIEDSQGRRLILCRGLSGSWAIEQRLEIEENYFGE